MTQTSQASVTDRLLRDESFLSGPPGRVHLARDVFGYPPPALHNGTHVDVPHDLARRPGFGAIGPLAIPDLAAQLRAALYTGFDAHHAELAPPALN